MDNTSATILVVEDDHDSATLLIDLLSAQGYRVISEASGLSASRLVQSEQVDLVVLDLRLPEQNGFVVAESIRSQPATAKLPIIVISAYNDRQNRMRAYRTGVNVVLSKPLDPAELALIVTNLVAVTK